MTFTVGSSETAATVASCSYMPVGQASFGRQKKTGSHHAANDGPFWSSNVHPPRNNADDSAATVKHCATAHPAERAAAYLDGGVRSEDRVINRIAEFSCGTSRYVERPAGIDHVGDRIGRCWFLELKAHGSEMFRRARHPRRQRQCGEATSWGDVGAKLQGQKREITAALGAPLDLVRVLDFETALWTHTRAE
jgi:hypothetical protein